jgi:hypothetical protein
LAAASKRPELANVPFLFWGHSAGASFGTTFAELHGQRTIGFIRYHTNRGELSRDVKPLKDIPALIMAGGKDNQNRMNDALDLWRSGRALGAPWTFVIEPEAIHFDDIDIRESNALTLPWIAAVTRLRLSNDGSPLRDITGTDSWVGNHETLRAAARAAFSGAMADASWLPDEPTSRGWERVARGNTSPVVPSLFKPTARNPRNPILGVWSGETTMGTFKLVAEILIERLDIGAPAGRIVYLDGTTPSCGSSLVLLAKSGTTGYTFAETTDIGRLCPSPGRVDIRLLEDGRLQVEKRFRRPVQPDAGPLGRGIFEFKRE